MKKMLAMIMGIVLLATTTFAQTKKEVKVKSAAPTAAPKMKANGTPDKRFKAATPAVPASKVVATKPAVAASPVGAPKMKANGTPDKRYKDTKMAAPAAGPTKKNGTPDMRYKANKKP